jgi:diguanylate cyclase (GGDEF)-like protein
MRRVSFTALIVGVMLIPTAFGLAKLGHDRDVSEVKRRLIAETDEHGSALENYFARARSIVLLTANSPAFARVLEEPATRSEKLRRQDQALRDVTHHLRYLERLYPASIGEACFINARGEEFARAVRGRVARAADLSTREESTVFFAPTFALRFGQVHQTQPYVSPDTKEWVVANSTLIPQADGRKRAIVHFEVTVESFRSAMGDTAGAHLRVIDGHTGRVVIDGHHPQRVGAGLGVPGDRRFVGIATSGRRAGILEAGGRLTAYRRIGGQVGNANAWIVTASALTPTGGVLTGTGLISVALLVLGLAVVTLAGLSLRAARRELEGHAAADPLTGLGNRRKLLLDLERRLRQATDQRPGVLILFDLNGFKSYNDTFGHPAGDALLQRLGDALADAVAPFSGRAYRPGGDEFCVIADAAGRQALEQAARAALTEHGEGFAISSAFGSVLIPTKRTTSARHCARRMRRCTPRSDPGAPQPDARPPMCCCRRCPSATPT